MQEKGIKIVKDIVLSFFMLIKMILFSDLQVITNEPITVIDNKVIVFKEPLNAINDGAYIEIDISNMFRQELLNDDRTMTSYYKIRAKVEQGIKYDDIQVYIYTKQNKKTLLYMNQWSINIQTDAIYINFKGDNTPVSIKRNFYKMEIKTKVLLKDIKISWINRGK